MSATAQPTSQTPNNDPSAEPTVDEQAADFGQPDDDEERSEDPAGEPDAAAASEDGGEDPAGGEPVLEPDPEEPGADDDKPPEFWSAEKKALWAKVTDPELRAAIKDHVAEVSRGTAKKLEESAIKVRQAEEGAKAALTNQEQLAAWWKTNGPNIQRMMLGRWANVDWDKLAAENPAEHVRLEREFRNEMGFAQEMAQRHQAEAQKVEDRQKTAHLTERAAEHQKLATKYPKEFGEGVAEKTYATLSEYVLKHGISPDRLQGIYEAPVVEIVRKAYRYDQLQAKAKGLTNPKQPGQPASTTPKRIVPGASQRGANQQSDAERQALERLRNGGSLSEEEAGLAFR